jgi:hypothetical protein
VSVEGAQRDHVEQHEQQIDRGELVEEELRAELVQGGDADLPSHQVQIDGQHGEEEIHGRAGRRYDEISPRGLELARIGGHGLRVSEANQHDHQQAHGVDVADRVERQPPRLLRGVVAEEFCREGMTELVEAERDHQRDDDDPEQ